MARSVKEQVGVDPDEEVAAVEEPAAERPEWLPDRFDSPEELAKSWTEAQRDVTQTRQQMRALEDRLNELAEAQSQQQTQPNYDPSADPILQQYEQAIEMGDARTVLAIQAYVAQQAAVQAVQAAQASSNDGDSRDKMLALVVDREMEARFPDWAQGLRQDVAEYIDTRRHLIPNSSDPVTHVQMLSDVADLIQAKKLVERGQQAGQQTDLSRQQKLLAQTMTGTSGRPAPQVNSAVDLVSRMKELGRPYGYSA